MQGFVFAFRGGYVSLLAGSCFRFFMFCNLLLQRSNFLFLAGSCFRLPGDASAVESFFVVAFLYPLAGSCLRLRGLAAGSCFRLRGLAFVFFPYLFCCGILPSLLSFYHLSGTCFRLRGLASAILGLMSVDYGARGRCSLCAHGDVFAVAGTCLCLRGLASVFFVMFCHLLLQYNNYIFLAGSCVRLRGLVSVFFLYLFCCGILPSFLFFIISLGVASVCGALHSQFCV